MVLDDFSTPSLYTIQSIFILDNDGNRIFAKYYDSTYSTVKEQRDFEKSLFQKTNKGEGDIILLDNLTIVYKQNVDVFIYVVGTKSENELILNSVLTCLYEVLNVVLKKTLEKKNVLDNLDLVTLVFDEICDQGIIFECDPHLIVQRVLPGMDDTPLSEQTVVQAFKSAQEQVKRSLLK